MEFAGKTEKEVLIAQTIWAAAKNIGLQGSALSFLGKNARSCQGGGLIDNGGSLNALIKEGMFRLAVLPTTAFKSLPSPVESLELSVTDQGYEVLYPTAKLLAAVEAFLDKDKAVANA